MRQFIKLTLAITIVTALTLNAKAERILSVDNLFTLIEQNSSELATLRSATAAADEGIAAARAARLPDINASLALNYNGNALLTNRQFGDAMWTHVPHFGNTLSLECVQVLYSGGAITAGEQLARLGKEQTLVATELTRSQQRFLAISHYLDLFKIDNGIRVYDSNIALTRRLIDDITERYNQGMVLRNDVTRYELQLETLLLGKVQLEDRRAIANHRLCNLLGLDVNERLVPDDAILATLRDSDTEQLWQQRALDASPALRRCDLNTQVARQEEQLARSEMLPKISVIAANNFTGPILTEVPPINKNINTWFIGVGVKYNLGSLYKSNHKLKQAKLNTQRTVEQRTVVVEQLNNDVQSAYTLYRQSFVALNTQQKSVQLATQNYEVVNDRYLNQLAIITDMIDASNVRLNAELQEVDARVNTIFALYRLKYASGTL